MGKIGLRGEGLSHKEGKCCIPIANVLYTACFIFKVFGGITVLGLSYLDDKSRELIYNQKNIQP